jgi:hypothetical protein
MPAVKIAATDTWSTVETNWASSIIRQNERGYRFARLWRRITDPRSAKSLN